MIDEIQWKIMNATIELIRDKGYSSTTTRDIAKLAEVNECTIFRKFKNKQDIVLCALNEQEWKPNITSDMFTQFAWELKTDLMMFSKIYLENVTPDFVKLSIGLRAPQIYDVTSDKIMKIPEIFVKALENYFEKMFEKGKIKEVDFESLAITFLSINFGFAFLKASFEDRLTTIENKEYIEQSVSTFVYGIEKSSS